MKNFQFDNPHMQPMTVEELCVVNGGIIPPWLIPLLPAAFAATEWWSDMWREVGEHMHDCECDG